MLWFVYGVLRLERWRCERDHPRGGYMDFTLSSPNMKGGTASANQDEAENSQGGVSQPPSHLRLIRDGGSTEVVIPLHEGRDE